MVTDSTVTHKGAASGDGSATAAKVVKQWVVDEDQVTFTLGSGGDCK